MVVGDDHDFAFHDRGKSVPVLGLKSPEIPAPNKGAIMVQAKKVVRFLGGPGYEDVLGVDTGSGGCKTVEFVVRVNLGRKVFLPKLFARLGIQAQNELFAGRLACAGREQLVAP